MAKGQKLYVESFDASEDNKEHNFVNKKGKTLRKNRLKKCAFQHNAKTNVKFFFCQNSAYYMCVYWAPIIV